MLIKNKFPFCQENIFIIVWVRLKVVQSVTTLNTAERDADF